MTSSASILLHALDDLIDEELKKFVFFLTQDLTQEGFPSIPRGKVNQKLREVVVNEMIEVHGEHNAPLVAIIILKKMQKNNSASKLKEQIQKDTNKRTKPDLNAVPLKKQKLADAPNQTCQPAEVENTSGKGQDLQSVMTRHKLWLKTENSFITEETARDKKKIRLDYIYTDLVIIKGESEARNNEHEVLMTENSQSSYDSRINCNDIFGQSEGEIKSVLTKGVAGIGKTVSVQKFILDWADDKANQDVRFLFVLPFRQLNLIEDRCWGLHELLVHLHPELKGCDSNMYIDEKILFIFDGLEESRSQLNFRKTFPISDVHAESTVRDLIINLISGQLLPSALKWITSRPAAANQIPSKYIHCVTEIQGFSDSQKEEYFRKRVSDPDKANRIISHIRTARSLHIMCHIPVFCWISVTALQPWLTCERREAIPTTLTEMYSHFLLVQMNRKNEKFDDRHEVDSRSLLESNKEMILKLAELAFKQLLKGNVLFYETDLKECGIDVQESFLYSGLCTEIFQMESEFYRTKVYCFVHLSFQEFFAALYVFHCYLCRNMEDVKVFLPETKRVKCHTYSEIPLDVLMKNAVNEALKSTNGHLDLFLRFLHGMSLESNQRLLKGFLPCTKTSSESIQKIKQNLKRGQKKNINPERWLNLSYCLIEMKDDSLQKEIQTYLESKTKSKKLTLAQCSAMATMFLQVSEEVMDELNLKKYNTSKEGCRRLIPALRNCKKAILADCNITETSCENIASVLQAANSSLRELDLSNNDLRDAGLRCLSEGLKSSTCKLEILSLFNCNVTSSSCALALSSINSCLRKLDLSYHNLQTGVNKLFTGLKSPECKLDTLRISYCKLTAESCQYIANVLAESPLRELDLSCNDLRDAGMKPLSKGLRKCNLNILKLSDCKLTEKSCTDIASVLQKTNSSLRELDLSDNDLLDSGVKVLCDGIRRSEPALEKLRLVGCCLTARSCSSLSSALQSNLTRLTELDLSYNHLQPSEWKRSSVLQTVKMDHDHESRIAPGPKKYACRLTLDPNTANTCLLLTASNTRMSLQTEHRPCQDHRQRFEHVKQVLCRERLSGRCYWEVEWHGSASIAVVYKTISKRGHRIDCEFGQSKKSWSLNLYPERCIVVHNKKKIVLSRPQGNAIGVYVDYPAGILSFYAISSDTHTRIHTFHTTFIEPLFAGFGLNSTESFISLIRS